jgi:hypothetical protein
MAWAPDYATSAQLKSYRRVPDGADDAEIALAITAASRAIDQATGRQFGKVDAAEDRYYRARYDRATWSWRVETDDLMDSTGLTIFLDPTRGETWTDSVITFVMRPRNASQKSRPWTEITIPYTSAAQPCQGDEVKVHAVWGWTAVPATIEQACLTQASRFLSRRDSPFGIAGSPQTGSELRLLAKVDPDVAVMVRDYERTWGAYGAGGAR